MKKYLFLMAGLGICASGVEAQESVDLTDDANRVSYAIGLNMGTSLKRQDIPVEKNALVEGLFSALGDSEPRLTQAEIQETLNAFRTKHQEMQAAKLKEEGAANRMKGEAFLAENGKKDGVVTLPSGLQYKIVEAGSGDKPGARDKVTVHYRGTLIDGTEFDSSYSRNEPATFPLNGVIKGWQEGLQLMSPGGHWEFYIPFRACVRQPWKSWWHRTGRNTGLRREADFRREGRSRRSAETAPADHERHHQGAFEGGA